MTLTVILAAVVGFGALSSCYSGENTTRPAITTADLSQARVFNEEMVRGRGDTPDIIEPEPTTAVSEMESTYNYILSRLAAMDQAIHRLNVGHYTLDIKVTQLLERMSRLENRLGDTEDAIQQVSSYCKDNRKEIGRLEGCQKGRKIGYKCFLAYRAYENYTDASQKCQERGGRMAMPRDRKEQEALAECFTTLIQHKIATHLRKTKREREREGF
uniref:C-type lectin domain family 11 member A-like n=2 Tax=Sinocyclocheilus rhinocerous TaxID=307959 RepID=A0A673JFV5_9TELE